MILPKKFYRVVAIKAGDKLRLYDLGSKTYANPKHAMAHLDSLRRRGIQCSLYESEPVVWKEVNTSPPVNHPTLPFD